MYKIFYKFNKIIFFKKNKNHINVNAHILLNPTTEQIKSALDTCFLKMNNINNLIVLSNNPQRYFDDFLSKLKKIECGGTIASNQYNELLMIKKYNIWDLPKGKIDEQEDAKQTAIRELKEETGIKSHEVIRQLNYSLHIYPLGDEWVLKKTYWFLLSAKKRKPIPQTKENISEAMWMNVIKINEIRKNVYPSVIPVIEEALSFITRSYTKK